MANVIDFAPGAGFEFTVYKHLLTDAENVFVNTYAAEAILAGNTADLKGLADALVYFERAIMLPSVWIERVECRTAARDSRPYTIDTFVTWEYGLQGQRAGAQGDDEPLNVALFVNRVLQSGKQGKVWYRGVLKEGDVWAPNGKPVLANATAMGTLINDAQTTSLIYQYFQGGSNTKLRLTVFTVRAPLVFIRWYLGLRVRGVAITKTRRKWHNRRHPLDPEVVAVYRDPADQFAEMGFPSDGGVTLTEPPDVGTYSTEYDQPSE